MAKDQRVLQGRTKKREKIAARVKARVKALPERERDPNIQPLNPGFFMLEAMRAAKGAKRKDRVRTKGQG